ncbi:hypothetical protein ACC846_38285, partial [Rhizobium ruizarguesonis]
RKITRWGDFAKVMEGIDAAQNAGLKIKLNAVALRDFNYAEMPELLRFAHGRGMDLIVIDRKIADIHWAQARKMPFLRGLERMV